MRGAGPGVGTPEEGPRRGKRPIADPLASRSGFNAKPNIRSHGLNANAPEENREPSLARDVRWILRVGREVAVGLEAKDDPGAGKLVAAALIAKRPLHNAVSAASQIWTLIELHGEMVTVVYW